MRFALGWVIVGIALALGAATAQAEGQRGGQAGNFDYYVLSLSWSPTWCGETRERENNPQCDMTRPYGFVVHGLWPQYTKGGYPSDCSTAQQRVPSEVVESMLPMMPSSALIHHEWRKHGTCSGENPTAYFSRIQSVMERLRIPAAFQHPQTPFSLELDQLESQFIAANPGLSPKGIAVLCRGNHGAEVRVCLDKATLAFQPCGRDVRDRCKTKRILFPTLR